MTTRVRSCGPDAMLLECEGIAEALSVAEAVRASCPEAIDIVPAARTVLVSARPGELARLRPQVLAALAGRAEASGTTCDSTCGGGGAQPAGASVSVETVVLDVVYDGPDLAQTAAMCGWSPSELVRAHTETVWRAAFGGFAPGFCYLVDERELATSAARSGLARWPSVPRFATPRTAVPAGSVALADRYCGVYPASSPGGWRILGRADAALWCLDRTPPALLRPGMRVRFRECA